MTFPQNSSWWNDPRVSEQRIEGELTPDINVGRQVKNQNIVKDRDNRLVPYRQLEDWIHRLHDLSLAAEAGVDGVHVDLDQITDEIGSYLRG